MDNSPAYIIAQHLIQQGELSDSSDSAGTWKVYIGALPDGDLVDHDAVACIDTTGVKDGRLMTGENIFHHGVQILLRSRDYNEGHSKISDLALFLSEVDNTSVSIGSDTYTINNVSQATGVVVLGQEEGTKRRELYSVNFLVTLQEE